MNEDSLRQVVNRIIVRWLATIQKVCGSIPKSLRLWRWIKMFIICTGSIKKTSIFAVKLIDIHRNSNEPSKLKHVEQQHQYKSIFVSNINFLGYVLRVCVIKQQIHESWARLTFWYVFLQCITFFRVTLVTSRQSYPRKTSLNRWQEST